MLNIQDWLAYRDPHHDPKPRDDAYYNQLRQPEGQELLTQLRTLLMPFDGGKAPERLRWLDQQVSAQMLKGGLPSVTTETALNGIREISNAIKMRTSASEWQSMQDFVTHNIDKIAYSDLQALQTELRDHNIDYSITYLRDCDEIYRDVSAHNEAIQEKHTEIQQWLAIQPEKPLSRTLSHYLSRWPAPSQGDKALELQQELAALTSQPTPSILYRLGESKAVKKSVLIDAINKSGYFGEQDIDDTNFENAKKIILGNIVQGIKSGVGDKSALLNVFGHNPIIAQLAPGYTTDSQRYIQSALTECIDHIYGNRATITDPEIEEISEKLFTTCVDENHRVCRFYGTEPHKLTQSSGAYAVGVSGHTLDKNMVWLLATIHNGRETTLCSDLKQDTIMRQTPGYADDPSAFAIELSGLIEVGYQMTYADGRFVMQPPQSHHGTDFNRLRAVKLADLASDMTNNSHKMHVLHNVSKALQQQQHFYHSTMQPLLTKYQVRTGVELKQRLESDIGHIVGNYRHNLSRPEMTTQNVLDHIEHQLTQPSLSFIDQGLLNYDKTVLTQYAQELNITRTCQQGIDDAQATQGQLATQANKYLNLNQYTNRLMAIEEQASRATAKHDVESLHLQAKLLHRELTMVQKTYRQLPLPMVKTLQQSTLMQKNKLSGKLRRLDRLDRSRSKKQGIERSQNYQTEYRNKLRSLSRSNRSVKSRPKAKTSTFPSKKN